MSGMRFDQLRRLGLAIVVVAFINGCSETVTEPDIICGKDRRASTEPLRHDPILFIHGYGGNGGNFCPMIERFRADGWSDNELYAYNYSFVAALATDAEEIRGQVDQILAATGAKKVDIIAHS